MSNSEIQLSDPAFQRRDGIDPISVNAASVLRRLTVVAAAERPRTGAPLAAQ